MIRTSTKNISAQATMFVAHGDVGDWRLPDEEFLRSFHLPSTRCDILRERHPFPRESRILFNELAHTYTIDGNDVMPRSVTGLIHQFTSAFDADSTIAQIMARESWAWKQRDYLRADGEVMTPTEIKQKWERNGLIQRSRGTLFHYHCEMFLNGAVVGGGCRLYGSVHFLLVVSSPGDEILSPGNEILSPGDQFCLPVTKSRLPASGWQNLCDGVLNLCDGVTSWRRGAKSVRRGDKTCTKMLFKISSQPLPRPLWKARPAPSSANGFRFSRT